MSNEGRLKRLRHQIRMAPGRLPSEVFQTHPTGSRPWRKTENTLEGLYILFSLGTCLDP